MDFLEMAAAGVQMNDVLTALAFEIIKIVAFGALGLVVIGFFLSLLCDVCECRKLRQTQARNQAWLLMP